MVSYYYYLLKWAVLLTISSSSSHRIKRIINGVEIVGRTTDGYDAVRYFGAIGTVHGTNLFSMAWHYFSTPEQLNCGSALITPLIVQTACHCLSTFETNKMYRIQRAVIDTNWESAKVVYVGVNAEYGSTWSMQTVNPIQSVKFFIHLKCGQFQSLAMTHDYGWIKVDTSWNSDVSGVPVGEGVTFAPLYTEKELANLWEYNLRKRAVCLHMGFGNFDFEKATTSRSLLHGWAVLMSVEECTYHRIHGIIGEDIYDYMNFFCSEPFPNHDEPTGSGDSGGPVTCNNFYFGVGSATRYNVSLPKSKGVSVNVNVDGGIAFAPFENAKQYRMEFINFINNYGELPNNELVRTRTFRPYE